MTSGDPQEPVSGAWRLILCMIGAAEAALARARAVARVNFILGSKDKRAGNVKNQWWLYQNEWSGLAKWANTWFGGELKTKVWAQL